MGEGEKRGGKLLGYEGGRSEGVIKKGKLQERLKGRVAAWF